MKTHLECAPCFLRQALEAARMSTGDESIHEEVLRRVAAEVSEMNLALPSPVMGQRIHRLIRELTHDSDPYLAVKEQTNRLAMDLYPEARNRVLEADEPLEMAVRTAIAGNILDFGIDSRFRRDTFHDTMDHAAAVPLHGDFGAFSQEAAAAETILYLADNAGEIVFDRILIEILGAERTTVVVRGYPVLNDTLYTDAETAGLTEVVEVISNESDAPGTILAECSEELRSRFTDADLVIAKGQGNYETLSTAPRPVWFVLMAKCETIARDIGCERGAFVLCSRHGGD
jgi:uncharacterized protein with ATP-grasp and redox domains